jgi:alpha-galactosidase
MERRHFIRWSGVALSSLLFTRWDAHTAPRESILPPARVMASLDTGWHELTLGGQGVYTYRDVTVRLKYQDAAVGNGAAVGVEVESPTQALHFIRLQWEQPLPPGASVLGDDWERTYGDAGFKPAAMERKMPWYFISHHESGDTCFGVKTGCNCLCYWQAGGALLSLTMDMRSGGMGVMLGSRVMTAANIVVMNGRKEDSTFITGRRFCALLCDTPQLAKAPVYGINDWYYAYGNNNPALILRQTRLMTELATSTTNRPFSLVDAGWAFYSPLQPGSGAWMDDFSRPNEKFKDMGQLAADIRKSGMRAGLWMRPLCASYKDPANLLLPPIPGRDDPKSPVLDPSIAENLERVKHNISIYREWGYEMVKHDFSTYDIMGKWGFGMADDVTAPGWRFSDNSRTTAEIILALYRSIREAAGDIYLIGCNTLSHLSAGLFELNRVGDDTSGKEWARTRKMGVNTLGFRMIQHDLFYAADGDCVGLTKDVPWEKNKEWMQLVAGCGCPLFISAQPDILGAEQRAVIRSSFDLASRRLPAGEPLDWLTNTLPSRWKLNEQVRKFDWA